MRDFQAALVRAMGCDPERLGTPGVSVAGSAHRAENHVTAGYLLDRHLYITCDPAVESRLQVAVASMEPTLEGWIALAGELDGELLGSGIMQVLRSGGLAHPGALPAGYKRHSLDPVAERALVEDFVERNTAEDLDEAEIELEDLDETVEVVLDDAGKIASWASAGPFEMAENYGDIGVVTHPDHRGRGIGRAAVAAVCSRIEELGLQPLYRCETDNAGSVALSRSLGFERATELTAFRFSV